MQAEQQSERERFEAWARPKWRHPEDFDQRIRGALGDYNSIEVQAAWLAWQARAALSRPSTPQGWPCEVVEADFSENTITLQMMDADYLVSAGEYRLIPPPPEQGGKG